LYFNLLKRSYKSLSLRSYERQVFGHHLLVFFISKGEQKGSNFKSKNELSPIPLKLLKDLEKLKRELRQLVAANSDLIEITRDDHFTLAIIRKGSPTVHFMISEARLLSDSKMDVSLEYSPRNRSSISAEKVNFDKRLQIIFLLAT